MANYERTYNIALAGNPNVGKSTVFNSFTGMHQHTGNWAGKTVENARGEYIYNNAKYLIQDLPGTYSLTPNSAEEEVTCEYILHEKYDVLVIILDAACPERNIKFAAELLDKVGHKVVICFNLIDEATKKGITIDTEKMSELLGVAVITTAARSGVGMDLLKKAIEKTARSEDNENISAKKADHKEVYAKCCTFKSNNTDQFDRKIDKYLISNLFGIPIMLIMLAFVFWITIVGANYPSEVLSNLFSMLGKRLKAFMLECNCPELITSAAIDGVYTTLTWIIAVMLPPMAIFFPLFTLMEDSGYLPRVAFNMDTAFKKCSAHGKQSLTMAMGFGCNACGVTGCRIIDSPRERLIAIITNSLVPCNGRFPMLIAIISMFMIGSFNGAAASLLKALILLALIIISVGMTLVLSKFLSKTFLKGVPSSFVLELPPYRRPQIGKVIIRSVFDRTLFVLLRAIVVAAPAGLFIWIMANVKIGDASILSYCTDFLEPLGSILGLDGAILIAFILGFPANEIVFPIILMIYMSSGTLTELPDLADLREILISNGWTLTTAICTLLFAMFHFPCSTTCLTILKETKSKKWTLLAFLLPLAVGVAVCMFVNLSTAAGNAVLQFCNN